MSDEEEDEEGCEENCEQCPHTQPTEGQKQMNMQDFLKKFGKYIKFGKDISKGKLPKELQEFFNFSRVSIDKTFMTSTNNLGQASVGMEKAFELLMKELKDKRIEPNSFTLGIIFALSRWAFLESEIIKKVEEAKVLKNKYII
jgi:hypothetical protein